MYAVMHAVVSCHGCRAAADADTNAAGAAAAVNTKSLEAQLAQLNQQLAQERAAR
jgi:hypothetical protein